MRKFLFSFAAALTSLLLTIASDRLYADNLHSSPNLYGQMGLNTIPNARMSEQGTVSLGSSIHDPYGHLWMGLQLIEPLNITLRQTGEFSSLRDDPKRLYPGLDLKLRLVEETRSQPEISVGLQSATGHKRMAGEYLALSKRYKSFDFSAGIGWGRYGTAAHLDNPLKNISPHFKKNRSIDGEMPNTPDDWFTGEHVGIFGGAEYFTPLKGLSIKADYGADRYTAERAASYDRPAPWSIGVNYAPTSYTDISAGLIGTDTIMARLSLNGNIKELKQAANRKNETPFRPYRTGLALPSEIKLAAQKDNIHLDNIIINAQQAAAFLELTNTTSSTAQIGLSAKHIANHSGQIAEQISIRTGYKGLTGPAISLNRRALEKAHNDGNGSAEELWHSATIWDENSNKSNNQPKKISPFFQLETQISPAEEDYGFLHRESFIAGLEGTLAKADRPAFLGFINWASSLRLNIADNLKHIANLRPQTLLPVRSNEDRFARRTFGLNTSYINVMHSITPAIHGSLSAGYLEEMYSGAGGEILYRPYKSRWAIGAESWLAFKRDPESSLNLAPNGDHLLTGHLNFWYDIPRYDMTLSTKLGRYLAEDTGATIGAQKTFKNGTKMEGFMTVTNAADFDLFGGTTHSYSGLRLTLPLGQYKYIPHNSKAIVTAAPFGRDTGQMLRNPEPLYEATEKFSLRHIAEHWEDIKR